MKLNIKSLLPKALLLSLVKAYPQDWNNYQDNSVRTVTETTTYTSTTTYILTTTVNYIITSTQNVYITTTPDCHCDIK